MKAEVSLYLDTRRALKSGAYPLKLHVYFTAKMERWYKTDYKLSNEQFEQSYLATKPRGGHKELKIELDAIIQKAAELAKDLGDNFTFEKFERKMFSSQASATDVCTYYRDYIDELTRYGRVGTASNYRLSLKSILEFAGKDNRPASNLAFSRVTVDFLNRYENWMVAADKSKTVYSGQSLPAFRSESLPRFPNETLPVAAGLQHFGCV